MLLHWLVAHDLEDTADDAVRVAAEAASTCGGPERPRLVLCHVVSQIPLVISSDVLGLPDAGALYAKDVEEQGVRLEEKAAELRRRYPRLRVETRLCRGPTVATLLDEAERQHVDAIAVGSHNRRGLSRFVLGSVATDLVAKSRKPVLVVKPEESRGPAIVM